MTAAEHDGPTGWFVAVRAPLDVAAARLAIFTTLLARGEGSATVGLRCADGAGDPAAVAALVDDLTWLGVAIAGEPVLTSTRRARYTTYAQRLRDGGHTYEDAAGLKLVVPPGQTILDDAVKGRVVFENAALGEIALLAPDGTVDEGFAAAIDDALLATPVVVRDDHGIEQTARGAIVLSVLGLWAPYYAHVGALLPDAGGDELPSIALLRRTGFLPAAVFAHLAQLGWSHTGGGQASREPAPPAVFSLHRVTRATTRFNDARLRALNASELQALPAEQLAALLAAGMQRAGLLEDPIPDAARRWIGTFLAAYGRQFSTLGEALAIVADLRAEAVVVPALQLERLRNRQVIFYLDSVGQYVDAQTELRDLPLDTDLPAIAQEFGIEPEDAFAALRMALTGKPDGAPLELIFPLLGHDRIMIRIGAISSHLLHGRGLEPLAYGPGGEPFKTIEPAAPPEP